MTSLNSQVVCVGEFNPAIITPDWLAAKGLISSDDLDLCRDSVQAVGKSRVMVFESKWFRFQALAEQLSIATIDGATPRIADLAASILELLPETPIAAFGLNFDAHYKVLNIADYHKFGDVLVPKEPFLNAIPIIGGHPSVPGVVHLTVGLDSNPRTVGGNQSPVRSQKRITIEPSNSVGPGIYFLYNNHIVVDEILGPESRTGALKAAEMIRQNWDEDFREAKVVFESLFSYALS